MSVTARVDHGRLLDVLGIEGRLLAAAAHGVPAGKPIPGCPGLTVAETVHHVAAGYRAARRWVRDGARPRGPDRPMRTEAEVLSSADEPVQTAVIDDLLGALDEVHSELAAHAPDEPCPTGWPVDETCGFVRRRLAHETTVHRVDVQAAAGRHVDPVPPDIAIDGIDEILRLWLGHRLGELGIVGNYRATVAVHAGGHEWIVRVGPAGAEVLGAADVGADGSTTPEGNAPLTGPAAWVTDAAVSGSPAGIYLWLWGRLPDRVVVVDGDHDAAAQLWALLRLATR